MQCVGEQGAYSTKEVSYLTNLSQYEPGTDQELPVAVAVLMMHHSTDHYISVTTIYDL